MLRCRAVDEKYSLEDLADATGIEKRTIRSYIQQGILRGPKAQGRKAFYTSHHLARLKALRFLRQYEGRSLDEIRASLLGMGDPQVEDLARRFDEMAQRQAGLVTGSASATSALDYIRSLKLQSPPAAATPDLVHFAAPSRELASRQATAPPNEAQSLPRRRGPMRAGGTPVDEILEVFEGLSAGRPVPRRAKGEAWVVIRVTPDLELHVRGVNSADQLARLERIADHLREALLGGLSHD